MEWGEEGVETNRFLKNWKALTPSNQQIIPR
jgi:hypothetical protein